MKNTECKKINKIKTGMQPEIIVISITIARNRQIVNTLYFISICTKIQHINEMERKLVLCLYIQF